MIPISYYAFPHEALIAMATRRGLSLKEVFLNAGFGRRYYETFAARLEWNPTVESLERVLKAMDVSLCSFFALLSSIVEGSVAALVDEPHGESLFHVDNSLVLAFLREKLGASFHFEAYPQLIHNQVKSQRSMKVVSLIAIGLSLKEGIAGFMRELFLYGQKR